MKCVVCAWFSIICGHVNILALTLVLSLFYSLCANAIKNQNNEHSHWTDILVIALIWIWWMRWNGVKILIHIKNTEWNVKRGKIITKRKMVESEIKKIEERVNTPNRFVCCAFVFSVCCVLLCCHCPSPFDCCRGCCCRGCHCCVRHIIFGFTFFCRSYSFRSCMKCVVNNKKKTVESKSFYKPAPESTTIKRILNS